MKPHLFHLIILAYLSAPAQASQGIVKTHFHPDGRLFVFSGQPAVDRLAGPRIMLSSQPQAVGSLVYCCGDHDTVTTVTVWDPASGAPLSHRSVDDWQGEVLISPDSRTIVDWGTRDCEGSPPNHVTAYDAETLARLYDVPIVGGHVSDVQFSPDSDVLGVRQGNDRSPGGTVRLIDARTGKVMDALRTKGSSILCLGLAAARIAVRNAEVGGSLELFDISPRKVLWRKAGSFGDCVFSPDGTALAIHERAVGPVANHTAGTSGSLRVYDAASGALRFQTVGDFATPPTFSADGATLAARVLLASAPEAARDSVRRIPSVVYYSAATGELLRTRLADQIDRPALDFDAWTPVPGSPLHWRTEHAYVDTPLPPTATPTPAPTGLARLLQRNRSRQAPTAAPQTWVSRQSFKKLHLQHPDEPHPRATLAVSENTRTPAFSPDGKWLADFTEAETLLYRTDTLALHARLPITPP